MAQELLTVILTSISCIAFCLVILLLVVVLYRKDPLCCRYRPHRTQDYIEDSPHFLSRPSLFGPALGPITPSASVSVVDQLPGGLFVIGKPHDYHLDGPRPRLPSYESVRKTDRQRHIHAMIAQRFGLDEPPPTYEETCLHSLSSTHIQPPEASPHSDSPDPRDDEQTPSPHSTALQEAVPSSL